MFNVVRLSQYVPVIAKNIITCLGGRIG